MATMATSRFCGYALRLHERSFSHIRGKELCFVKRISSVTVRSFSFKRPPNLQNAKQNSTLLLGIVGCSAGALAGAGYAYFKLQESRTGQKPIINQGTGTEGKVLASLPDVQPTKQILIPTDNTGLKLILFQYTTCPFCCKVRAFLDYYGFSYDIVEVNPVLRKEVKWSDYRKVPILLAQVEDGYQQLNDSSMIISALTSFMIDRDQSLKDVVKCFPSIAYNDDAGQLKTEIMNRYFLMFQGDSMPKGRTKESILQERKWRKWADDTLVHVLSPNVYRTRQEALQAFNWFSEVGDWQTHFKSWERYLVIYVGASAMWLIGKRLKKRHNLKEDVRQSLYDECNFWARTIKRQNTAFMGGINPDLSDLAVYGVLNSIEGCDAFSDVLKHTKIGAWYARMKTAVQSHEGSSIMNLELEAGYIVVHAERISYMKETA